MAWGDFFFPLCVKNKPKCVAFHHVQAESINLQLAMAVQGKGRLEAIHTRYLQIHQDHGIALIPQQPDSIVTVVDQISGSLSRH
jgi:hypothetical protein